MAAQDQDGPAIPPDATPMMAQYLAIKAGNEGALLFYRMGDFYELFFEDAVKAAAVLGIALTKRGRHLGEEIPMCGVPAAGAEPYLERLIREGFKVAICEQTEDPAAARKRGGKSVVHREVVRLVTPGTITEDALLDARRSNALAALARVQGVYALASADLGSGRFVCRALPEQSVAAALARIAPGELLVPDTLASEPSLESVVRELGPRATILPPARFDSANGERALKSLYGVAALDAFGQFSRSEMAAAGAIADYLAVTQKGALPLLRPLMQERDGALLELDPATRRNLELTETLEGARSGSLLDVLDMTMTAPGARLLAERLAGPLAQSPAINQRLDAVAALETARDLRAGLRERLKTAPDLARALQRLVLKRGGPRDLSALRHGIETADALRTALDATAEPLGLELAAIAAALGAGGADLSSFAAELRRCLGPDLPLQARDGGFIAEGANPVLDEMRGLRDDSRRVIAALELRLKDETGINALKIKHNNVLGYFVEVTATHAAKLLNGAGAQAFIHRQTLPNAARFTTTELSGLAGRIVEAAARALEVELSLFETLASQAVALGEALSTRAEALAALDVAAALAERAAQSGWVRPKVDDSFAFDIEAGRHPVVEQALKRDGVTFTANDCDLSEADGGRIWLVTGPNMAGKSTFLRQNALICILAQMGSFVPAARARIGAADRVFSRVGAADDLARGRSTFMVEMVETAAILAQAGPRALVILDEIGRGTATFDGLSIAWGAIEHLHEVNRARALFATHYHELVALAKRLERLRPVTMRVREWKGEVVFLHEVAPGAADRSYGIQVAKLAGLPKSVITRAEAVLAALERGDEARKARTMLDDLPLFSAVSGPDPHAASAPLLARLADITPDSLSPKEALELVYELKRLAAALP